MPRLGALSATCSDVTALRELFTELLGDRTTVQRLAGLTSGAGIHYDRGGTSTLPSSAGSAHP